MVTSLTAGVLCGLLIGVGECSQLLMIVFTMKCFVLLYEVRHWLACTDTAAGAGVIPPTALQIMPCSTTEFSMVRRNQKALLLCSAHTEVMHTCCQCRVQDSSSLMKTYDMLLQLALNLTKVWEEEADLSCCTSWRI